MKTDRLVVGAFETNCSVMRKGDGGGDCLVIDAGLEGGEVIDFLHKHKLKPVAVVLTHGHIDHTAGVIDLRKAFPGAKVYIHKLDAEMLTGGRDNLSGLAGCFFTTGPADSLIEEDTVVEVAGIRLQVLHTPGHTPGGISLYAKDEGIIFVGDTLFAGSVGRTDFPGGSMSQLVAGIREKLLTLPDSTIVYPGHGPATTIAQEKKNNPFL